MEPQEKLRLKIRIKNVRKLLESEVILGVVELLKEEEPSGTEHRQEVGQEVILLHIGNENLAGL